MARRCVRPASALCAVNAPRWSQRSLWGVAVFPAAVFAVHQLCYLFAYGSGAGPELAAHGDHYVPVAAIVASALAALSLGLGLLRLVPAWRGRAQPQKTRLPVWLLWLVITVALLAGFCVLEGLEMLFEPHHAGGIVGIFGQGGWWALPASGFVSALLTLLVGGGRLLLAIVTRGRIAADTLRVALWHPRVALRVLRAPMSGCAAGRAPPATELA